MSRITRRLSLQPTSSHPQPVKTPTKNFKLLLLGAGSVGKTQLLNRFLSTPFSPRYHRTVEELHLLETPGLHLEILDTAGSYEFPAMRNLNIINSDGYVVVFDVGDEASIQEAVNLLQLINSSKQKPRITLAANKIDLLNLIDLESLSNNAIYTQLQSDYNLIQTSAKSGDGCERLWKQAVGDLGPCVEKLRRVSVGEVVEQKHGKHQDNKECRLA